MKLTIVPIDFAGANTFVKYHHRHHGPVVGTKFCIAVAREGKIVGVVMVGRPVARNADDQFTLEVNRCCTDGTPNACSMLYSAAWRAARALGYSRLITYTLSTENGSSLKASNWKLIGEHKSRSWNCPSRPRIDADVLLEGQKLLWEAV